MADLLEAYFQRDLSLEELDQVEAQLLGPEENARRFAGLAEAFNRSTGLTQGRWKRRLAWMGLAGAAALLGWWALGPAPDPGLIAMPRIESPLEEKGYVTTAVPEPPGAAVRPLSAETTRPAHDLGIRFSLSSPRQVRVHVLDKKAQPVARLFHGPLGAGDWSFSWNGTINGSIAPRGLYVIQVVGTEGEILRSIELPLGMR